MDHASAPDTDRDPVVPPELPAEEAPEPAAARSGVSQDDGASAVAAEVPEPAQPQGPIQERVLKALKAHITPALPAELAATLDVPEKTLKRLLGKMARDGSVRRAGGGRFTVSRHYHA